MCLSICLLFESHYKYDFLVKESENEVAQLRPTPMLTSK